MEFPGTQASARTERGLRGAAARMKTGPGLATAPAPGRALRRAPFSLSCSLTRSFPSRPRVPPHSPTRRTAAIPARNCRSRFRARPPCPRHPGPAPSSRPARDRRAVPSPGFAAEQGRATLPGHATREKQRCRPAPRSLARVWGSSNSKMSVVAQLWNDARRQPLRVF